MPVPREGSWCWFWREVGVRQASQVWVPQPCPKAPCRSPSWSLPSKRGESRNREGGSRNARPPSSLAVCGASLEASTISTASALLVMTTGRPLPGTTAEDQFSGAAFKFSSFNNYFEIEATKRIKRLCVWSLFTVLCRMDFLGM